MMHRVIQFFTPTLLAGIACLGLLSATGFAQSYPTNPQSRVLDPALSGSWFDPAKDGQGLTMQVIDDSQLLVTWFTYDSEGNQAWMQGIGAFAGNDLVVDELNRYTGPTFGDDYDPNDRQTAPSGELRLSFSSCDVGQARYTGSGQWTNDTLELERLTNLHGHDCGQTGASSLSANPPTGALSGAWYAPAQNGQGWMIEVLDPQTALVYWFTYDESGQQRWMLGVGGLDNGTLSIDDLEILTGPQFGPNYDADEIARQTWGDATLHLWPCDKASARYLSNGRSGRLSGVEPLVTIQGTQPCITPKPKVVETDIWTEEGQLVWREEDLEDQTPWCDQSVRWNAPITDFDINLDGKNDLLLVISCYQGPIPDENEKHNRQVVAAWRMFCSSEDDDHYDCTRELFGTNEIRATPATDSYGGSPYTHVMEQPRDLNGDGYPEFWYALNRDDGRPGLNADDPEDQKILTRLCGDLSEWDNDRWEWDCTHKAAQTMLISQVSADGIVSYAVEPLPWEPRYTQAMTVVPNHVGGHDILAFNYGPSNAARLTSDGTLIDVTDEYKNYQNAEPAMTAHPYVATFRHEETQYVVTAQIPTSIYENLSDAERPPAWETDAYNVLGFTLWRWIPGEGFEVSDVYMPPVEDRFVYKQRTGEEGSQLKAGAMVKDIPAYGPAWNFFSFEKLHPNEEPILIVGQESGSTAGKYFKAPPDPEAIYDAAWFGVKDNYDYQHDIFPLTAIEGFYIRDGKLVPREQPVVEGNATWSVVGLRFQDVTGDGLVDLVGDTGGIERGAIYINNGQGTLNKLKLREIDADPPLITDVDPGAPWAFSSFTVRDLGRAPHLEYIYWGFGSYRHYWDGDRPERGYPFAIMKSKAPITKAPLETPEEFHDFLSKCLPAGCSTHFAGYVP